MCVLQFLINSINSVLISIFNAIKANGKARVSTLQLPTDRKIELVMGSFIEHKISVIMH